MFPDYVNPIGLGGLTFAGLAMIWALKIVYRGRPTGQLVGALPIWVRHVAVLFILVGVLGPAAVATFPFGIPVVAIVLVVVAMVVHRYRMGEVRGLLEQLIFAAERQLSLSSAARSFARDRVDELGCRAEAVATNLDRGYAVDDALRAARVRVPFDLGLQLRLACTKSGVGMPLNDLSMSTSGTSSVLIQFVHQAFYVALIVAIGCVVLLFFMLKIAPTFGMVFSEFGQPLPKVTQVLLSVAEIVDQTKVFLFAVLPWLVMGVVLASVYYVGWLTWEPPLVRRLLLPLHAGPILHAVASYLEVGYSFPKALDALAGACPSKHVKIRLNEASRRVFQGESSWRALHSVGLIDRTSKGVLESAERAGNLPWAMRQMAVHRLQKLQFRLGIVLRLVGPIALILIGFAVGFICVAVLLPLSQLIHGMA